MSDSIGSALPGELARCEGLIERYEAIGPAGAFGKMMIQQVINEARAAQSSSDVAAMVRSFAAMQGCE